MSLCTCSERPRCQYHHCGDPADWSVWIPSWNKTGLPGYPKFFCSPCYEYYKSAWKTPIRGIDRPEHADEDWRPSLSDMMRHAQIAIAFENRDAQAKALASMGSFRRYGDEKYTPAQLQQLMVLRRHLAHSSPEHKP